MKKTILAVALGSLFISPAFAEEQSLASSASAPTENINFQDALKKNFYRQIEKIQNSLPTEIEAGITMTNVRALETQIDYTYQVDLDKVISSRLPQDIKDNLKTQAEKNLLKENIKKDLCQKTKAKLCISLEISRIANPDIEAINIHYLNPDNSKLSDCPVTYADCQEKTE